MVVDCIADHDSLQRGLDELSRWADKWQLSVSVPKCSVLHLGSRNSCLNYEFKTIILPNVSSVIDLGVTVDSKLRFKEQINSVVIKAHQRACLIMRCFHSRDPKLLFRAFCVYVRPLMEYCVPVWSPGYNTDIIKIEAVQRRFTKRLRGFRLLTYRERLSKLNIDSLELRRMKLSLLIIYKILHGLIVIDSSIFVLSTTCTRGHSFKLVKPTANINCRRFSFACQYIDIWNFLPDSVVCAANVFAFKKLLHKVDFSKFIQAPM
jgi:hypothetical protein